MSGNLRVLVELRVESAVVPRRSANSRFYRIELDFSSVTALTFDTNSSNEEGDGLKFDRSSSREKGGKTREDAVIPGGKIRTGYYLSDQYF